MFRAVGRFTACAALTLVLFFVVRSLLLTTIQTPESEPHYEVRYAGVSPEAMLGVVFLLPLLTGLLFAVFYRRTIRKHVAIAATVLVFPAAFGLVTVFNTIFGRRLPSNQDSQQHRKHCDHDLPEVQSYRRIDFSA